MKSFRTSIACFLLSVVFIPVTAQTIPSVDAKNHIGERATVCGRVVNKHASPSQGRPTFIDLDKSYPSQPFTVLVWERDKKTVGALPSNGQLCVTGTIIQYRGGAEVVLHNAASWYAPKAQSAPSPQLSNDRHYTNIDDQQVHSPAYSSGGVPAGATAVCRDETYSFSQHRSGTCSHHGGVAKWL
jgi:hypothetical protein